MKVLGLAALCPTMGAVAVPSSSHHERHHAFPTSGGRWGWGGGTSEGPRCSETKSPSRPFLLWAVCTACFGRTGRKVTLKHVVVLVRDFLQTDACCCHSWLQTWATAGGPRLCVPREHTVAEHVPFKCEPPKLNNPGQMAKGESMPPNSSTRKCHRRAGAPGEACRQV